MKSFSGSPGASTPITILSHVDTIDPHPEWYEIADAAHFWMQWRLTALLHLLKRNSLSLDVPLHVLDIGCGHGILTAQMEDASSWTIDGADLNMTALEKGPASRGTKFFYNIDDYHVDLIDRYDAVLLFDVLEHIARPTEFLHSALRHVRPGGHLLINVPAMQPLFSAYDRAAGHLRRYDRRSLTAEFSGLHGVLLDTAYWGMTLLPVLAIRKALLSKTTTNSEILQKGFQVTNPIINRCFLLLMRLETALLRRPPLGASLLALFRKES